MSSPIGNNTGPETLDLRDYVRVLRDRRKTIIAFTIAGLALAAIYSFVVPAQYRAKAVVEVQPTGVVLTDLATAGLDKAISITNEAQVVDSTAAAEIADRTLNDPRTPQALLKHVSVNVPQDTQVLEIYFVDGSAAAAQRGAQAFADAYLAYRQTQAEASVSAQQDALANRITSLQTELERQLGIIATKSGPPEREATQRKNQLQTIIPNVEAQLDALKGINTDPGQVIVRASLPKGPSSPNLKLSLFLGLFGGLALGVGYSFLRDRLDDRLRSRADLEDVLSLPVLGLVPKVETWTDPARPMLVTVQEPRTPAAEAYRTLRTSVLVSAARHDVKTILVASASEGDGKTVTAANLAVALAKAGKRVVLVSADLRKPRLHDFFALENDLGFAEILSGKIPAWEGLHEAGIENLWIFPSGEDSEEATDLLQSDRMEDFLTERRNVVDFLIVDSPPLLAVADGLELASRVDAVLFVADAERTTRASIEEARDALARVGARVMGAVLNRARISPSESSYVQAKTNGRSPSTGARVPETEKAETRRRDAREA